MREIAEAQQRWEDNRQAEAAEARKQYQQPILRTPCGDYTPYSPQAKQARII